MRKIKAADMVHDQVGGSQEPNMEKKDQLAQKPDDVVESTSLAGRSTTSSTPALFQ